MTKFIVHIGDGKCGSTAIQNALYQSRADLKECGIYFDTLAPNSGHTALSLLAGQRSRAASDKREALARGILALLQEGSREYEWVVLSAENLINLTPKAATDLLNTIGRSIESINVIAYVRNPPEMYASSIQQIIKGSHHFPPPESHHRRVDHKLKAWKEWIGADQIKVRLFERQYLIGGDIVADFSNYLTHVSDKKLFLSPVVSNRSLSVEQTRVLQNFRKTVYPEYKDVLLPRSTLLARFFTQINQIKFVGNQTVLSNIAHDVISHGNQDVIHGLRNCFPDLPLLEIPIEDLSIPKGPFPWADGENVETIFAFSDQEIVKQLSDLLPDLNGGIHLDAAQIEELMTNLSFHNESNRQAFISAYHNYLEARMLCQC